MSDEKKALMKLLNSDNDDVSGKLLQLLKNKALEDNEVVTVDDLKARYKKLSEKNRFKEGDIVTWKAGLSDRKVPKDGEPAIVVKILYDKPIMDGENDATSPYFKNEYNLVLGFIKGGRFMTSYQISDRFEHYKGE